MKIKLMSDIHLEFPRSDVELTRDDADVLILAGDICTVHNIEKFIPFFEKAAAMFPHVIYIMGNHESYHGSIDGDFGSAKRAMEELSTRFGNLHVLDGDSIQIDGVLFWAGTLWANANNDNPMSKIYLDGNMNDFRLIEYDGGRFNPGDMVKDHEAYLAKLNAHLEINGGKPCVVVTHHAPTLKSIAAKYANDFHMNGGYASDLSALIDAHPEIKLWCHGHTHTSFDYMEGQTRVLCNPAGYPIRGRDGKLYRENPEFDPQLVVEI